MDGVTDVVMFSGGVASWAAAKRLVETKGKQGVVLLFADTKMEDEDLYRFIDEAAMDVGVPLVKIAEGRTPWQVFNDERMMGSTRTDPCSRILKRELLDKWIIANCQTETLTVHMGFTFEEMHRWDRMKARWQKPWAVSSPLCDEPWVSRGEINEWLATTGIAIPRLYTMGFAHNNCGGFCVKAGQGSFAMLLEQMPERFAYHATQEQDFRERVGKDVAILRDRTGGTTAPLPLMEFRRRREANAPFPDWDMGGCNCMEDPADVD